MKKTTFLILAELFIVFTHLQQASAQNSSPYWSLAGNSNASSSSKLGTTNLIPLRLMTNNATRLYITPKVGWVGIGTTSPTEQLHVNSASGKNILRGQVGGVTKLLLASNGGLSVGSGATPPTNGLYVNGRVGIGTNAPAVRLHIAGTDPNAIAVQVSNGGLNVAIPWSTGDEFVGIRSDAGIGVYGTGMTGVQGEGMTGVYGSGYQGISGIGQDYGVGGYATDDGYNGNGIYGQGAGTGYAGYFDGNVYATGSYLPSDRTLKQHIADFTSALAIIGKLQPKTYEYRQDGAYKLMHLPEGTRYGLIAQDVAQVLPGLVRDNKFQTRLTMLHKPGTKTDATQPSETISFQVLNYTELIPIVIKGMQELEAENKALKEENAAMNERLNKLETLLGGNNATIISLARLEQNTPNPVSGTTTIRYQVPLNATTARITITTAKGQLVQTLNLSNRGAGQVDFNSATLASGTYNYTLWVDGKQAGTRRFVIAR